MRSILAAAILSVATAALAGNNAAAKLEPERISLDEAAQLSVPSETGGSVPSVDGLDFTQTGQSTEVSIVNGAMTQRVFTLYQVTAQRPGSYSIPIGQTALRLEVLPPGSRAAMPGADERTSARSGPLGLLRVVLPKRRLYAGEATPVTVKADFALGTEVTLNGLPTLSTPAFVIGQLPDKPRQGDEEIGGAPYHFASWTGALTAAKAGPADAVATLPIVVRYREAQAAQDPFGAMFNGDDDPFQGLAAPGSQLGAMMKRMRGPNAGMFGATQQRELTLRSPALAVEVLPLPVAGRPDDFSGAVGQFDVKASIVERTATQYEPLRLRVEVSGTGNFDRVSSAGLASNPDWHAYASTASFDEGKGSAGLAGAKIFEQAIAPQRSGDLEVPALRFSYFDPVRGTYVTKTTSPISMPVAAATGAAPQAAAQPDQHEQPEPIAANAATNPQPAAALHAGSAALVLPYRHAWFWLLQLMPLLLIGLAWLLRSGTATSPRAERREREESLRAQREQMKQALIAQDERAYFESARRALQEKVAARLQMAPEEITAAEIEDRLGEDFAETARVLGVTERSRYGGRVPLRASLDEWDAIIGRELDRPGEQP
jgi:hypothetical protein